MKNKSYHKKNRGYYKKGRGCDSKSPRKRKLEEKTTIKKLEEKVVNKVKI